MEIFCFWFASSSTARTKYEINYRMGAKWGKKKSHWSVDRIPLCAFFFSCVFFYLKNSFPAIWFLFCSRTVHNEIFFMDFFRFQIFGKKKSSAVKSKNNEQEFQIIFNEEFDIKISYFISQDCIFMHKKPTKCTKKMSSTFFFLLVKLFSNLCELNIFVWWSTRYRIEYEARTLKLGCSSFVLNYFIIIASQSCCIINGKSMIHGWMIGTPAVWWLDCRCCHCHRKCFTIVSAFEAFINVTTKDKPQQTKWREQQQRQRLNTDKNNQLHVP